MVSMPSGPKPIIPSSLPSSVEKSKDAPATQSQVDQVAKKSIEAQQQKSSAAPLGERDVKHIKTPWLKAIWNAIMDLFRKIFSLFSSSANQPPVQAIQPPKPTLGEGKKPNEVTPLLTLERSPYKKLN